MLRHFAWFRRETGEWIGEWRGHVPEPAVPPDLVGGDRTRLLNAWQQALACCMSPDGSPFALEEEAWNVDAWDACPSSGAVCVDVTDFQWPVGHHVWHVWNDLTRLIDWPESSVHHFIEVRLDTLQIVANQSSHRPIRSAVPGQMVLDITGTPLEQYHGRLYGWFVFERDRWCLVPASVVLPLHLDAAPIEMDLAPLARARVLAEVHV